MFTRLSGFAAKFQRAPQPYSGVDRVPTRRGEEKGTRRGLLNICEKKTDDDRERRGTNENMRADETSRERLTDRRKKAWTEETCEGKEGKRLRVQKKTQKEVESRVCVGFQQRSTTVRR